MGKISFSEYIANQEDAFLKAGDAYEGLSELSKSVIDLAVERYINYLLETGIKSFSS